MRRMARLGGLGVALLLGGAGQGEFVGARVVDESFDPPTLTDFGAALLANRHITLAEGEGVAGGRAIRVEYRGNARGTERVIVNYPLPGAVRYTLSFDVKFCPGFDFRKGGKLHGLGPASPVAGGNPVTAERWSARAMFRRQGGLQSYLYSQDMSGRYGDALVARGFRFETDRYYAISFQVELNQPASAANGFVRIYVDGAEVIHRRNIRFRSRDSAQSHIRTLMFNTFHGGHTPDWAPRNADGSYAVECAYFDNFSATPALMIKPFPG